MDRTVLLVLLGLQVFLIIASFTSANAATLVTDPQQLPPYPVGSRNDYNRETFGNRHKRRSNCRGRPGACGLMGLPGPPAPPSPPTGVWRKKNGRANKTA